MTLLGANPELRALGEGFQAWLDAQRDALARFREPAPEAYEDRVDGIRDLQRRLFDAGWARYGWPEALGGLGGSVLHRAVVIDLLSRNGYPPRYLLEHLEILPPALARYARPELVERLFLPTLRSDVIWCQGFSEPSAGSDLANLKTRATTVEGGYRIDGHKIWTSWARFADHCLLLARTGTPESRHRGLSAFVVRLDSPGLTVQSIRQANGTDELAEVFFDGVLVPEEQRVGPLNEGWSVAMEILAGERGSYGWLRSTHLLERLERLARMPGAAAHPRALGEVLVHLLALRCRSREVMEIIAAGGKPGPESSVSKVLVIDADRALYDVAREVLAPALDLGTLDESWEWQESYLYSRASGIYGGTRQIQLNVIAKHMVKTGQAQRHEVGDEVGAVRASVAEAAEQSASGREALAGLDWWAFAAEPSDALGRSAFSAWFEHQGATLGHSPALAGVSCAPLAAHLGVPAADVALAVTAPVARGDVLSVHAIGWDAGCRWLALPGDPDAKPGALQVVAADRVETAAWPALDRELGVIAQLPGGALQAVSLDGAACARAQALGRLGAAFEMLGAAGAITKLVVEYTNQREQFGQSLSSFQAVQHMLSECQVYHASIASLADAALEQWSAGDTDALAAARAAKALAGRAGRGVAQHTLQCFGAISFTDEHPHHRYLRRIHTLDAVLGSLYQLERELGAQLIETKTAPRCVEAWRPHQHPE